VIQPLALNSGPQFERNHVASVQVSILPFDVIGYLVGVTSVSQLKVVRIVRLMRLMKLVRIAKASRCVACVWAGTSPRS
jgi:hypothetical protein